MPETSARLPAETKVDRPSPRSRTFSRIAEPSAPDWQKKPARPRGGITGDSEALSATSGAVLMMPRRWGRSAAGRRCGHSPTSWRCRLPALVAGLGEAGGDHDEAVDALGGAVEHDVVHRLGRARRRRDVDVVGDVADRRRRPACRRPTSAAGFTT